MNDRVDVALAEAMESVGQLAPEAPPLPQHGAVRRHRPLLVLSAAFVSVIVVVGVAAFALNSLRGAEQEAPVSVITPTQLPNAFVGSWISDDLPVGTELRVSIDSFGAFDTWDEIVISGPCAGGSVTASGAGEFRGDAFIAPRTNRVCHPADNSASFPMADADPPLTYLRDEATDTIILTIDGGCYYRLGTDPTVCES